MKRVRRLGIGEIKDRLKARYPHIVTRYYSRPAIAVRRFISRFLPSEVIFAQIHASNSWGSAESVSGPGSDLAETAAIRDALPSILQEHGIRTLLDAPCGDLNWIVRTPLDLDSYFGVDIVGSVIAENRRRFGNERRHFAKCDLTTDPLPRADLILCRDCFVHLPFTHIIAAIRNFRRSGARYLLTTTYPGLLDENKDAVMGTWRPLDLQLPPFNFPDPILTINEKTAREIDFPQKSLALWELARIPE